MLDAACVGHLCSAPGARSGAGSSHLPVKVRSLTDPSLALQKDISKAREVFDDFLAKYPLCYGYWMQYVAAEASHGDQAETVLERGVAATPYSIELWLHYIDRLRKSEVSAEDIRRCTRSASAPCLRNHTVKTQAAFCCAPTPAVRAQSQTHADGHTALPAQVF